MTGSYRLLVFVPAFCLLVIFFVQLNTVDMHWEIKGYLQRRPYEKKIDFRNETVDFRVFSALLKDSVPNGHTIELPLWKPLLDEILWSEQINKNNNCSIRVAVIEPSGGDTIIRDGPEKVKMLGRSNVIHSGTIWSRWNSFIRQESTGVYDTTATDVYRCTAGKAKIAWKGVYCFNKYLWGYLLRLNADYIS